MSKRQNRPDLRVLLDANVWRYIADAPGQSSKLDQIVRRRDLKLLVAPAVVYEALRTRDSDVRNRLLRVMTQPQWRKLMPEAYMEAEEFIQAVRRVRPGWLKTASDLAWREANRRDWLPGPRSFWSRVKAKPDEVAQQVSILESDILARAREHSHRSRALSIEAGWNYDTVALEKVTATPYFQLPGWDGRPIPAWRVSALAASSVSFLQPPHQDWVVPIVDLRGGALIHDESWVRFWFYDSRRSELPRFWIRGAIEILQSLRKVTDGTPCDAQLATYVFEADVFITYDRAFADILERCRSVSPLQMADVVRLETSRNTAGDLLDFLENMRRNLDRTWGGRCTTGR